MSAATGELPPDKADAVATRRARRRRRKTFAGAVLALLVSAAVVAWASGVFDAGHARSGGVSDNEYPTSITTVAEGSLASQISDSGTLEYTTSGGSDYNVVNQASGTFTELPAAGETVSRGQVLYRVSNDPEILFYGTTPVYRSLSEGDTGPDVRELNRNLVALGYTTSADVDWDWDYFSAETAYALERLEYKPGGGRDRRVGRGAGRVPPRAGADQLDQRNPGNKRWTRRADHAGDLDQPAGSRRPKRLRTDRGKGRRQRAGHAPGWAGHAGGGKQHGHRFHRAQGPGLRCRSTSPSSTRRPAARSTKLL